MQFNSIVNYSTTVIWSKIYLVVYIKEVEIIKKAIAILFICAFRFLIFTNRLTR